MDGPRLSFLGSTGGIANAALFHALRAGYHCHALARSSSKLYDMLETRGLRDPQNLEVTEGSVSPETVARVLIVNGRSATAVLSGVGWAQSDLFAWQANTICADTAEILTAAIRKLDIDLHVIVISSCSIQAARDFPLLLWPIYKILLARPAADKRKMEGTIEATGNYTIVAPSLLTDAPAAAVREGAIGYVVSREAVATWIWHRLLREDIRGRNTRINITF